MKAKHMIYLIVVVLFRVAAVFAALSGIFMIATPMLLTGFNAPTMMFRFLFVYCGAAVLLWLISKPIASFILSGLDDDPGV